METAATDQPTGGRFVGAEHRFPVRVYFEDTDLSGVVYHANYLRWLERARSDMLRLAGIDQRAFHDAGEGAFAVADIRIRYRAPARLDDAVLVISRVTGWGAATVSIHQTVRRVDVERGDVELASAEVTAALVAANGRPRRQPPRWTAIYQRLLEERE